MLDDDARIPVLWLGEMMMDADRRLGDRFEVLSAEEADLDAIIAARGNDIRAVTTRGKRPVDDALLDRLPNVEIVAAFAVGYESVDTDAAKARNVVVTNTPDVLNDEVADLAVGLLIATIREIPQADRHLREGGWSDQPYRLTSSLRERTIGIAGMGRIGRAIAERLVPFGRPIAYHARRPVADVPYAHHPTLLGLAEACDTLIVILPGGPATKHAVNAEVLKALGADGVLINVARGSCVDEAALVQALADRTIAAAGLDVFEKEPGFTPALAAMDNVVLLPHVGSGSVHTRTLMADLGVKNLVSWFEGRGPVTPVAETPWTGAK